MTTNVVICAPEQFPLRRITHCPTCARRRRFSGLDHGMWYGITWTCCGCGDQWSEGERAPRPFRRGWRKESATRAQTVWAAARPKAEHRAWLRAQIDDYRDWSVDEGTGIEVSR